MIKDIKMKTKYSKAIITVLFIGFIVFWIVWTEYKSHSIKNNFALTIGKVTGITKQTYKNKSKSIIYTYEVNGIRYTGENGLSSCNEMTSEELRMLLVNKLFLVAYEKGDVENSSIIISQDEAEIYNCKLTDEQIQVDSIISCK